MSRPLVTIYDSENEEAKNKGLKQKSQTALPDVFSAPIRTDIVVRMHFFVRSNKRHPYSVSRWAGHQTAAESWGTGRAVSRIPRVPGSGTHRAGQGAFGNMCRGGRMFSPSKTWRRWMHKIKKNERRYATASAIAASGVTSLVMARGHKVERLNEVPLVVTDDIQAYVKSKQAMAFLKRCRAIDDVRKVKNTKVLRPGKGKNRNRKYKQRLGPLIVYKENKGITKAFRNVPGVDVCPVDQLNLLQLAPGGHVGRFIIWTESAFKELNGRFGTYGQKGDSKFHLRNGAPYRLPRSVVQNSDIDRLIQSDEVQSVIRDPKNKPKLQYKRKNPLKDVFTMNKLNPLAISLKRRRHRENIRNQTKKTKPSWESAKKDKIQKKNAVLIKKTSKKYFDTVLKSTVLSK